MGILWYSDVVLCSAVSCGLVWMILIALRFIACDISLDLALSRIASRESRVEILITGKDGCAVVRGGRLIFLCGSCMWMWVFVVVAEEGDGAEWDGMEWYGMACRGVGEGVWSGLGWGDGGLRGYVLLCSLCLLCYTLLCYGILCYFMMSGVVVYAIYVRTVTYSK